MDTRLPNHILALRVEDLECWPELREEMMFSNVLQRDNVTLAKRLHPMMENQARVNDQNVSHKKQRCLPTVDFQAKNEKMWNPQARREVVQNILDSWTSEFQDDATVEVLFIALCYPDFKDLKMRFEKMIEESL